MNTNSSYNKDTSYNTNGVTCSVTNCVYHCSGDKCNAAVIHVGNETAESKRETMCSTFECEQNAKY